jgi:hypothetical protein
MYMMDWMLVKRYTELAWTFEVNALLYIASIVCHISEYLDD